MEVYCTIISAFVHVLTFDNKNLKSQINILSLNSQEKQYIR